MLNFNSIPQNLICWWQLILHERFGHSWKISIKANKLVLRLNGNEGKIIFTEFNKEFYVHGGKIGCQDLELDKYGLSSLISNKITVPGIKNKNKALILHSNGNIQIRYDFFGFIFWALCRIEEISVVKGDDEHGRFSAYQSHAGKNRYLDLPLVDIWFDILKQLINRTWPNLNTKKNMFRIRLSHDVDRPSAYGFLNWPKLLRTISGHLVKRRDFKEVFITLNSKLYSTNSIYDNDPFNTFDWIMELSEKISVESTFNFICGGTNQKYDADYLIDSNPIKNLLYNIYKRGHKIGLHPSYDSYNNEEKLSAEFLKLKETCKNLKIKQECFGGRTHYLRWEHPKTLQLLDKIGLTYDNSLGFYDHTGFRCGTCHEYTAFDPIKMKVLNLKIRPLIVMDSTLFGSNYMNITSSEEIYDKLLALKRICNLFCGEFTLLWHNSDLIDPSLRKIYSEFVLSS
tara:strand:+ start:884 stop:2251 length:1368 start_codon:yes stop_codon:yes gene_type:complete